MGMEDGVKIKIRLGKTGSGKTLDQTEEDVLPALIDEQEVHSCYWINWNKPNWHYFAPRDFESIKNLRNCIIVFDELRQAFDPRSWENETEEVRSFFELHRHRHNDIIGNTQDVSLVAKTVGVQAHEWIQVEKVEKTKFIKWLEYKMDKEAIMIQKEYLSFQQLKKMAAGWEIGEAVRIENEWQRINYKIKDLIHPELDEFKIELVHRYCPRCKMRQGDQILKENTLEICKFNREADRYDLKEVEYCPKHKEQELEIRKSGMFDTDYEPEVKEKELIFKPFMKKEIWSEFRGGLSVRQAEYKEFIEKQGIPKDYQYQDKYNIGKRESNQG